MTRHLRIATRASRLALWQAHHVAARLRALDPALEIDIVELTTAGDRILDRPLAKIGGKGLFIKELEQALLEDRADLAVHSMRDVPAELPADLHIVAVLEREDPRDVLVTPGGLTLDALPAGSRVGTSSLRRASQLLAHRPDLAIESLRGNVPTRLARLAEGRFDGIVLAAAGLERLGLRDARCHALAVDIMLPAVGQGAIGIECRRGDAPVERHLVALDAPATACCMAAERAMNATLGGSCEVPVAGYARLEGGVIEITGLVAAVDGSDVVRQTSSGPAAAAASLGARLGESMLAAGADRILEAIVRGA